VVQIPSKGTPGSGLPPRGGKQRFPSVFQNGVERAASPTEKLQAVLAAKIKASHIPMQTVSISAHSASARLPGGYVRKVSLMSDGLQVWKSLVLTALMYCAYVWWCAVLMYRACSVLKN
jgi:hypothetical protein